MSFSCQDVAINDNDGNLEGHIVTILPSAPLLPKY